MPCGSLRPGRVAERARLPCSLCGAEQELGFCGGSWALQSRLGFLWVPGCSPLVGDLQLLMAVGALEHVKGPWQRGCKGVCSHTRKKGVSLTYLRALNAKYCLKDKKRTAEILL